MKDKIDLLYNELIKAIETDDRTVQKEKIEEIDNLIKDEKDVEILKYFKEKNNEIIQWIQPQKENLKQLLLIRNNQNKAVKKYDQF